MDKATEDTQSVESMDDFISDHANAVDSTDCLLSDHADTDEKDIIIQASGGDYHKQLEAGLYYIRKSNIESGEQAQSTAEHAITWLCKASRQGNEEATQELRDALDRSLGVTDDNLDEVKWCIQTTPLEKRARLAARGLFQSINPLSTDTRLLDKLDKHERKLIEKALKSGQNDEHKFVEKIVKRLHGSGGLTLDALLQSNVEMEAYNNATTWQKVTRYPGKLITVSADKTIEAFGQQGMMWLTKLIPTNQIYMVLAFFIYSLITLDLLLWFIPLVFFYASYFTMAISTMQMFYARRKQKDVHTIAKLLARFNDALDNESAESAYDWAKLSPYVTYFIALVFMVGSFAISDHSWIPCSELVCCSAFFCVTCFYALSDAYDHLVLVAIGMDFFSKLPYIIAVLPEIPLIKTVLMLVASNIYSLQIVPGLSLNIGLPSITFLVVPLIFIRMAIQKSWQGWYRILVPHLVCYFWWKVTAILFYSTTVLGLLRASIGWVSLIVLLPIVALVSFVWGLINVVRVMTVSNVLTVFITFCLLALPILLGLWTKGTLKLTKFSFLQKPWVKRSLLVFVFVAMFSCMFLATPIELDVEGHFITWDQYKRFCSKPQWDQTNMADAQLKCAHLKHSIVEWEGTVKKITVKEIKNQAEDFLSHLPLSMSDWIKCAYGEKYPDCDVISDATDREMCELVTLQGHQTCHLRNLDIYKFEMWVLMPIDDENLADVRIEASNWFKNALLPIKEGDVVSFRASLKNNLGNLWPELNLYYLKCESRGIEYGSKTTLSETSWRVVDHIRRGTYTIWNFFFAPIFEFK